MLNLVTKKVSFSAEQLLDKKNVTCSLQKVLCFVLNQECYTLGTKPEGWRATICKNSKFNPWPFHFPKAAKRKKKKKKEAMTKN